MSRERGSVIFTIAWGIGAKAGWRSPIALARDRPGMPCTSTCWPLAQPRETPPCGFLGDGLPRCEPRGSSTTGLIHLRVAIGDLDDDGLFDLIVGCARGGAVWYPNRGRRGEPSFASARLLFSDGKPLDVGWSSAPQAVDWDGDGRLDLVVGAEWNRVLLYRNRGTKREPRFEYAGPLTTDDGQPLALPVEPVPEGPDIYKRDYYPVLETVDWDHDGDLDLLAGGYVTGRIYFYRNIADRGHEPRLQLVGPLEADEKPIDVQWAAAPAVADLDADGDLDLITGCMPMTPGGGDSASSEHFLHYFRNDGTAQRRASTRFLCRAAARSPWRPWPARG